VAFYRRVHPGGPGWTRIAQLAGGPDPEPLSGLVVDWIAGCVLIYATLFGAGTLLLTSVAAALPYLAAAAVAAAVIYRDLARRGWETVTR